MSKDDPANLYDEEYFLRGKQSGKSLYEDYRWLPDLTIPMVEAIAHHCGFDSSHDILDFGCARGYTVKALRMLGFAGYGVDVSPWAINNADPSIVAAVSLIAKSYDIPRNKYDWIIAKDVLEHVPFVRSTVMDLMGAARVGVFAVVPLSMYDGGEYIIKEYEKDVTHKQRFTLATWVKMFLSPGWRVEAAYRLPGVKDNWYTPTTQLGNGFITARRIP